MSDNNVTKQICKIFSRIYLFQIQLSSSFLTLTTSCHSGVFLQIIREPILMMYKICILYVYHIACGQLICKQRYFYLIYANLMPKLLANQIARWQRVRTVNHGSVVRIPAEIFSFFRIAQNEPFSSPKCSSCTLQNISPFL